jgi:Fe2+ transport system protein FeoA
MTAAFFRRARPSRPGSLTVIDLGTGQTATITGIESLDPARLVKLSSLGLMRGVRVRLVQTAPAVVIQIAETTVALDRDVARDILVELD